MKEEQAKKQRCCGPNGCGTLINPASGGNIPHDLLMQLVKEVNSPRWCIASDCMVWQEHGSKRLNGNGVFDDSVVKIKGGYCGLTK